MLQIIFDFVKKNKLVFACLLISLVFLFKNLGNIYFWSDEAYTAVNARNSITFGYPKSFDGRNIIQAYWLVNGKLKLTPYYRTMPWLHIYMAAASFAWLGFTTFAGRLPFAITGFMALVSVFLFMRKYEREEFITRTAVVLLTFCIPFFLYMRQCRYYAPATLFTVLGAWGYLDFYHTGRKRWFILAAIFLFLSLQSAFVVLMLGIFIHALLRLDRERFKQLVISGVWISLAAVPVIIMLRLWEQPADMVDWEKGFLPGKYFSRFISYLLNINDFVFPLLLIAIFLVWGFKRKLFNRAVFAGREHVTLLAILVVANILFLSVAAPQNFRLMVQHLPLICILGAYVIYFFKQRLGNAAAAALIVLTTAANVPHIAPYYVIRASQIPVILEKLPNSKYVLLAKWGMMYKMNEHMELRSHVREFLYEITHDYDGPIEGIARYINAHAGEDDIVKVSYGDYALQFYTDRLVIPRGEITNEIIPDWLILRGRYWMSRQHNPPLDKYFAPLIQREFEKIALNNYPEMSWENLPEPEYHKYKTPEIGGDVEPVVIYRRKKPYPRMSREEKLKMIGQLWERILNK